MNLSFYSYSGEEETSSVASLYGSSEYEYTTYNFTDLESYLNDSDVSSDSESDEIDENDNDEEEVYGVVLDKLTVTKGCKCRNNIEKDWNHKFQQLNLLSESEEKYTRMSRLAREFVHTASTYGKVIISERSIPLQNKSISPINIGGTAGGDKYIVHGILFKFAVDSSNLYGGDEFAQKAAGHDLKGLMSFWLAEVKSLHLPLMTIINYMGYSLIAMSLLPLCDDSLKYGSDDGGRTMHFDDPVLSEKMKKAAAYLNLKGHIAGVVPPSYTDLVEVYGKHELSDGYIISETDTDGEGEEKNVSNTNRSTITNDKLPLMFGPGDLEGHLGLDGKYYVLDFARLFPPQARYIPPSPSITAAMDTMKDNPESFPPIPAPTLTLLTPPPGQSGEILYRLLRPELVRRWPNALSSDAFTGWSRNDPFRKEHNSEVFECTRALFHDVIPDFVKLKLDQHHSNCQVQPLWDPCGNKQGNRSSIRRRGANPYQYVQDMVGWVNDLHAAGINVRHLGYVRALLLLGEKKRGVGWESANNGEKQDSTTTQELPETPNPLTPPSPLPSEQSIELLSTLCLLEMIARVLKDKLHRMWRSTTHQNGLVMEELCKERTVEMLNLIVGYNESYVSVGVDLDEEKINEKEDQNTTTNSTTSTTTDICSNTLCRHDKYWRQTLKVALTRKFPHSLSLQECHPEFSLKAILEHPLALYFVILRATQLVGLEFSPTFLEQIVQSDTHTSLWYAEGFSGFIAQDLHAVRIRVKHMHVVEVADAKALLLAGLRHEGSRSSRMFTIAVQQFRKLPLSSSQVSFFLDFGHQLRVKWKKCGEEATRVLAREMLEMALSLVISSVGVLKHRGEGSEKGNEAEEVLGELGSHSKDRCSVTIQHPTGKGKGDNALLKRERELELHLRVELVLLDNNYSSMVKDLQRVVQFSHQHPYPLYHLAKMEQRRGHYDTSLQSWRQLFVVSSTPHSHSHTEKITTAATEKTAILTTISNTLNPTPTHTLPYTSQPSEKLRSTWQRLLGIHPPIPHALTGKMLTYAARCIIQLWLSKSDDVRGDESGEWECEAEVVLSLLTTALQRDPTVSRLLPLHDYTEHGPSLLLLLRLSHRIPSLAPAIHTTLRTLQHVPLTPAHSLTTTELQECVCVLAPQCTSLHLSHLTLSSTDLCHVLAHVVHRLHTLHLLYCEELPQEVLQVCAPSTTLTSLTLSHTPHLLPPCYTPQQLIALLPPFVISLTFTHLPAITTAVVAKLMERYLPKMVMEDETNSVEPSDKIDESDKADKIDESHKIDKNECSDIFLGRDETETTPIPPHLLHLTLSECPITFPLSPHFLHQGASFLCLTHLTLILTPSLFRSGESGGGASGADEAEEQPRDDGNGSGSGGGEREEKTSDDAFMCDAPEIIAILHALPKLLYCSLKNSEGFSLGALVQSLAWLGHPTLEQFQLPPGQTLQFAGGQRRHWYCSKNWALNSMGYQTLKCQNMDREYELSPLIFTIQQHKLGHMTDYKWGSGPGEYLFHMRGRQWHVMLDTHNLVSGHVMQTGPSKRINLTVCGTTSSQTIMKNRTQWSLFNINTSLGGFRRTVSVHFPPGSCITLLLGVLMRAVANIMIDD